MCATLVPIGNQTVWGRENEKNGVLCTCARKEGKEGMKRLGRHFFHPHPQLAWVTAIKVQWEVGAELCLAGLVGGACDSDLRVVSSRPCWMWSLLKKKKKLEGGVKSISRRSYFNEWSGSDKNDEGKNNNINIYILCSVLTNSGTMLSTCYAKVY